MEHDDLGGDGDDGSGTGGASGGASGGLPIGGPRRLTRSPDDRVFSGLSAGIAAYFGLDPLVVRIVWIVLAVVTSGTALLVYALIAVIVPVGSHDGSGPATPPDPAANERLRSMLLVILAVVAAIALLPLAFGLLFSLPLLLLASVPLLFLAAIVWVLWLLLRPKP